MVIDRHVVIMNVDHHVSDHTSVGVDHVAALGIAGGINAVPVDFEAHAVEAGLEVGGYGERRHGEVLVIDTCAFGVDFVAGCVCVCRERHYVRSFGRHSALLQCGVETSVVVTVQIAVGVHPRSVEADGGCDGLAGFGGELFVQTVLVHELVRLLSQADGLVAVGRSFQLYVGGVAVFTVQRECVFVAADGIIFGGDSGCGRVVDNDFVHIEQEILGEIVG